MTPESLRVKQWRESNRDRYNERQKILMRDRRAKAREAKKAAATPKYSEVLKRISSPFSVTFIPYKED